MDGDVHARIGMPEHIAVVRLWSLEPAQVKVTAVGMMPGVSAQEGEFFAIEMHAPNSRLAEVVLRGPHKIADHRWHFIHGLPVLESLQRKRLGAHHDETRQATMDFAIFISGVV